jgi:hypothetical protein
MSGRERDTSRLGECDMEINRHCEVGAMWGAKPRHGHDREAGRWAAKKQMLNRNNKERYQRLAVARARAFAWRAALDVLPRLHFPGRDPGFLFLGAWGGAGSSESSMTIGC